MSDKNETVILNTTLGDIEIELYIKYMPITAGNFLKLVNDGFYNGVIFHRVISGFMIQGGDPTGTGRGGPGYKIPDEFPKEAAALNKNSRGTISMANAGPNTGGSQFFFNLVENKHLDGKHSVFGKVTKGMDVIDTIAKVKKGPGDRPVEDVAIITARVK